MITITRVKRNFYEQNHINKTVYTRHDDVGQLRLTTCIIKSLNFIERLLPSLHSKIYQVLHLRLLHNAHDAERGAQTRFRFLNHKLFDYAFESFL